MKDLLQLILTNITTHPEDIKIDESMEDNQTVFTITVHPDDMGRVIGKSGKVIRAIRSIAHVVGIRREERYRINVAEVEGSTPTESDMPSSTNDTSAEVEAPDTDEDLLSGAIDLSTPEDATTDTEE